MRKWPALFALIPLLAGCAGGGSVAVPVPSPDAAAATACRALRMPAIVHGQKRRTTDPASPYVAAWGDPAIAVRCGVTRPADALRELGTQLVTLDGVDWLPMSADRPVTFTAVGREAYVEVTVPAKYTERNPAGDVLLDLTPTVKAIPALADGAL